MIAKITHSGVPEPNEASPNSRAVEEFHRIRQYVLTPPIAARVWEEVLTPEEKKRLGGEFYQALNDHRTTVAWLQKLHNLSYQRSVIEVGRRLGWLSDSKADWLLREGGEEPINLSQCEAINRGHLVIERYSRTVWWQTELLEITWGNKHAVWDFFLLACEHAKENKPMDHFSFGADARENIVSQRRHALKLIPGFPSQLLACFESVGRGTQRFNFPGGQIHLIDD
ncbi:hypothetical protein [Rubinisphaera margarita]|uniref:hypothetical protein n=1 Tax=Rubinisphaera margarita TaxID=2909586 RepID=UPI001EE8519E|nr:hypothetical protein [Rubinisphaera margarita]MCG6157271.1 hypothetical protein [Rubinisphaera margarita]